jgi:hypothetical protein
LDFKRLSLRKMKGFSKIKKQLGERVDFWRVVRWRGREAGGLANSLGLGGIEGQVGAKGERLQAALAPSASATTY